MNVNYKKTKEMLLGAVNGNEIGQLIVDGNTISRVYTFMLLGIQVESNLKWKSHVDYIHVKAFSRLYPQTPVPVIPPGRLAQIDLSCVDVL